MNNLPSIEQAENWIDVIKGSEFADPVIAIIEDWIRIKESEQPGVIYCSDRMPTADDADGNGRVRWFFDDGSYATTPWENLNDGFYKRFAIAWQHPDAPIPDPLPQPPKPESKAFTGQCKHGIRIADRCKDCYPPATELGPAEKKILKYLRTRIYAPRRKAIATKRGR